MQPIFGVGAEEILSGEGKPRESSLMRRNLWLFWLLLILIVSTYPCAEFHTHPHWEKVDWVPFHSLWRRANLLIDAVKNVLLYVPLGFFYGHSRLHSRRTVVIKVALLSAILSAGCEFFQVFCHGRHPTMTDLATNVIGGVLGAVVALRYRSGKQ
jgi:glycopeptide antibiotics resistance protein